MTSAEENVKVLIEAWKLMVGRLPGSRIEHAGGVATMFGQVPLPFLNLSAHDRPLADEEDLRRILAVARERAGACQHGSFVAICDAWAPKVWQRLAAAEGFTRAVNMTGMAADRLLPPQRALPELEFRRVLDETTARDLAMINGQAYGMSLQLFECICNLHLWHEDSFGYVGYAGGRAVTAAATFPVVGTVYVAFVSTLPEAHGKGYAEAAMRQAIAQGGPAMGLTRMTLHASDMGRPLYRSMGFEPGASVVLLEASQASAGH
jgi:GNAT superfamily N-acetyltransferase